VPLGEEQTVRLKQTLLKKGQEIAEMLADVLAGNVPPGLAEVVKPGETPEEKLRRFLDTIQARIVAMREGSYGRCEICGEEIRFEELDEMPWADTCSSCAAKGLAKI
jgi:hypothetical protein